MGKSDWIFVNFSQDYELDHILSMLGFDKSEENRQKLRNFELKAKEYYGKGSSDNITHDEFYEFIKKNW